LNLDEIKAFAKQYDPQRFHVDEDAASKTHFGGLVASGFQTQLMCFGPFCREVLIGTHAVGAPGIDDLKWLRPWRPLEDLNVTVTVVDKRISSKRNDRGYLRFKLKADSDDNAVLTMEWVVMILTRANAV
jgi:acyl dehydratase